MLTKLYAVFNVKKSTKCIELAWVVTYGTKGDAIELIFRVTDCKICSQVNLDSSYKMVSVK